MASACFRGVTWFSLFVLATAPTAYRSIAISVIPATTITRGHRGDRRRSLKYCVHGKTVLAIICHPFTCERNPNRAFLHVCWNQSLADFTRSDESFHEWPTGHELSWYILSYLINLPLWKVSPVMNHSRQSISVTNFLARLPVRGGVSSVQETSIRNFGYSAKVQREGT